MSVAAAVIMLFGGLVSVLAGVGILKFRTSYARFHAAGKASPVAFLVAAVGASIELGWTGAVLLVVGAAAMTLTLPIGVHLLFRAAHRSVDNSHMEVDDLAASRRRPTEG